MQENEMRMQEMKMQVFGFLHILIFFLFSVFSRMQEDEMCMQEMEVHVFVVLMV